jgi:GNAT superfamily N-acetyltransferase
MRTVICPTQLHFHDLASHFLALSAGDRFLRFGWVISDVDIVAYVEGLLQSIGSVFVVVEPAPDIAGALHIELAKRDGDLGLSVAAWARGKGIGTLLLQRAGLMASARGVRTLFVRNLNSNEALRRLARHVGMQVACAPGARSTPLGSSNWGSNGARHGPLRGLVTLADHSLRSQWNCGGEPDSRVDDELQEEIQT